MPSQAKERNKMSAFFIGYKAFKNNDSGVPSMNKDLQDFMASSGVWSSNKHETIMEAMVQFKDGWNKAEKEWEVDFFANE